MPSVFSLEGLTQAQLAGLGAAAPRRHIVRSACGPGKMMTPYGCQQSMPSSAHFGHACSPGKMMTPYGCQQAMPAHATFGDPSLVTVNFPAYGSPLAPHGAPIGPARPETPVFGPGGTPVMYRRHFPDRGPVVDYCAPAVYVGPDGSSNGNLGDVSDFIGQQTPAVGAAMVVGGTLAIAALLAGGAVFILKKVGHRSMARK